jgi:hypothetical protein
LQPCQGGPGEKAGFPAAGEHVAKEALSNSLYAHQELGKLSLSEREKLSLSNMLSAGKQAFLDERGKTCDGSTYLKHPRTEKNMLGCGIVAKHQLANDMLQGQPVSGRRSNVCVGGSLGHTCLILWP